MLATEVLEMTVKAKAEGQDVLNIVHYRAVDPLTFIPNELDILVYLNQFALLWRSTALPLVHTSYTVISYVAQVLVGTVVNPTPPPPNQIAVGDQRIRVGIPAEDTGLQGSNPLPTFVAVGVRKFSDRAGRSFRGGLRVGPLGELQVDGNALSPAQIIAWAAAWTTFKDALLETAPTNTLEASVFSPSRALAAPVPNLNLRSDTAKWVASLINSFATSQVSRKQSATATT
jgi:hypothetical protein